MGKESQEIVGPNKDNGNVESLIGCRILPPKHLFHPLLPVRSYNRLIFGLCRKRIEDQIQEDCHHEFEKNKWFEDVWVADELRYAIKLAL